MVDYNLKLEDILSDYYQMIDEFDLISKTISNNSFTIDINDNADIKRRKENQKKKVLQDLGRILELSFKYILKIKRLELYPNEPYENEPTGRIKGFKEKETFPKPVVNDLANKSHIPQSKVNSDIYSVTGIGPVAHNFTYLYKIIEVILPNINKSMQDFFENKLKSKIAIEEIDDEEIAATEYAVFPKEIWTPTKDERQISEETKKIIENRIKTINENGDIFTRLRYFANNPDKKNFDVEEIYELTKDVVDFSKAIHINKEKLNIDSQLLFASFILNTNEKYNRFSKEELNKLLENEKIKEDPRILLEILFYCSMTCDEALEVLSMDIKSYDGYYGYSPIFTNNLTKKEILYFYDKNIYDFDDMSHYLGGNSFPGIVFNIRNSIEGLERLRVELCNNTNDFSNLELLGYLSVNSVKNLLNYPELLNFYKTEFIKNINKFSYNFSDKMFELLLSNKSVRQNPLSLYGLDYDQLTCYSCFVDIISKEPLNKRIINESNYYVDSIDNHITENIKRFSYDKRLLCVLPLMLDPDDIERILHILQDNGLDLNNLRGLDTTILCMPPELVRAIVKSLEINGEKLIINNNVNPSIYNAIEALKKTYNSDIKIEKRRIPFYSTLVHNFNDNTVNDLIYDKENFIYTDNNSKTR